MRRAELRDRRIGQRTCRTKTNAERVGSAEGDGVIGEDGVADVRIDHPPFVTGRALGPVGIAYNIVEGNEFANRSAGAGPANVTGSEGKAVALRQDDLIAEIGDGVEFSA